MHVQAVEQVISALHVIQGLDGSDRGKRKIRQVGAHLPRCCCAHKRGLGLLAVGCGEPSAPGSLPSCTLAIQCSCTTHCICCLCVACPQLRDNSNYFRRGLLELGFDVLGDWDSPVMVRRWRAL